MFDTDISFRYRVQGPTSGVNCRTQPASLLALTQTLTICNQCPKVTNLIPGRIRQPCKQLLQTFSNTSNFRKSKEIGIWTKFCPACQFRERWTRREFLSLSRYAATHGGVQEDDEECCFTPSEVLLYQHVQDHRCIDIGYLWSI